MGLLGVSNWFITVDGTDEISGAEYASAIAWGWGESAQLGPNIADNASGVFWGAFALFAATTASIMSGAVIERIQTVGFVILAIVLGSFAWVVAAAWGWHADGWLVTKFGVHDFGAAGLVHAVAGFFALGVLINLGPRIGKFNEDGTANHVAGHNLPLTTTGHAIIVGFGGFNGLHDTTRRRLELVFTHWGHYLRHTHELISVSIQHINGYIGRNNWSLDYYPRSILDDVWGSRRDYISGFRFRHLLSGNNLHSCFCRRSAT